jgi:hypothetical protein
MDGLFHFPDAKRRHPEVAAWFEERGEPLGNLAQRFFERMRACGDDVCEIIHDGSPRACVHDAAFAYVDAFPAHVNVGFFRGADLPDPEGILLGSGKRMRHVKLRPDEPVDEEALHALIVAAYEDMRARLEAL